MAGASFIECSDVGNLEERGIGGVFLRLSFLTSVGILALTILPAGALAGYFQFPSLPVEDPPPLPGPDVPVGAIEPPFYAIPDVPGASWLRSYLIEVWYYAEVYVAAGPNAWCDPFCPLPLPP